MLAEWSGEHQGVRIDTYDLDTRWRCEYHARRITYGPTFESAFDLQWDELVRELGEACSAYLLR